jgi:two-component system LytT family response regulator
MFFFFSMIRVCLVEDNSLLLKTLMSVFTLFFPDVEICATATNVADMVECLLTSTPDLVVCDLMIPGGTSLDALVLYRQRTGCGEGTANELPFELMFITGHEEKALEAARYGSCGVLMKPVNEDDIVSVMRCVRERIVRRRAEAVLEALAARNDLRAATFNIPERKKHIAHLASTLYVEADGDAVILVFADGKRRTVVQRLSHYADVLPDLVMQVHKSYVVNLLHVVRWQHNDKDAIAIMRNGTNVPVSRTFKKDFIARYDELRRLIKLSR